MRRLCPHHHHGNNLFAIVFRLNLQLRRRLLSLKGRKPLAQIDHIARKNYQKLVKTIRTLAKTFSRYHFVLLYAIVWDRGLSIICSSGCSLFLSNFEVSQNFPPAGKVVRRPSVPRQLLVLLQSYCKVMLIILTKVIVLISIQYHAERVQSLSVITIVCYLI